MFEGFSEELLREEASETESVIDVIKAPDVDFMW